MLDELDTLAGEVDVATAAPSILLAAAGHGGRQVQPGVLFVGGMAGERGKLVAVEGVALAGVADRGTVNDFGAGRVSDCSVRYGERLQPSSVRAGVEISCFTDPSTEPFDPVLTAARFRQRHPPPRRSIAVLVIAQERKRGVRLVAERRRPRHNLSESPL